MATKKTVFMAATVAMSLLLGGCGLSKAYPAKDHFYLSVDRAEEPNDLNGPVVRLRPLNISSAFAGKGLVFRVENSKYESAYYAEFFSAPDDMMTDLMGAWLRRCGGFRGVIGSASTLPAEFVVEGMIDRLYADSLDPANPRAVISLQLRFIDDRGPKPEVLASKYYSRDESVLSRNPTDVVSGWNRALETIFEDIEQDAKTILK